MHPHVVSDSSGRTLHPPSFGLGFRVCPLRVIGRHETERRGRAAASRRRPCRLSDVCCRRQLRRFRSRWPARAIAGRSRGAPGAQWGSPDGRRAGPVIVCRVERASPIQGGDHPPPRPPARLRDVEPRWRRQLAGCSGRRWPRRPADDTAIRPGEAQSGPHPTYALAGLPAQRHDRAFGPRVHSRAHD
jgi:hypothetical protein